MQNPNPVFSQWLPLKVAAKTLGCSANGLYQQLIKGRLGEKGEGWTRDEGPNGMYYVARNSLGGIKVRKVGKSAPTKKVLAGDLRLKVNRKPNKVSKKSVLNLGEGVGKQKAEPATASNSDIGHNIAYAAGHCQAWLENYATGRDLPVRALAAAVGQVLKDGAK